MRVLAALLLLSGCGFLTEYRDTSVPMTVQADFDVSRYTGIWHEVARFPVTFQRGCVGVTAEYQPRPDGRVSVLNICRNPDGSEDSRIYGSAEPVAPAKLLVRFPTVPFVASDYWVLWVDDSYETAVVGAPNGRSGWILHRSPQIPADKLATARDVLRENGYDLSQLEIMDE